MAAVACSVAHMQERMSTLEEQLSDARQGEAKAKGYEYQLILLQHSDLQQQDRCDQLQETAQDVNLELQALQIELQLLQGASPSDEECIDSSELTAAGIKLRCYELRLGLQQAQLDSLRASRDHLLTMRPNESGGTPAEVQLQSLLEYTQDLEKLLDGCQPGSSGKARSGTNAATAAEKQCTQDFLYNSCFADVPLKPRISKARLQSHQAMCGISNASTSVGTASVQSAWDVHDTAALAAFLLPQQPPGAVGLQLSPPKDASAKQRKKVAQQVRFRPPLRMNRDRSGSPSAPSKPRRSLRRSSSKELKTVQLSSESTWSLPDFTDWYS